MGHFLFFDTNTPFSGVASMRRVHTNIETVVLTPEEVKKSKAYTSTPHRHSGGGPGEEPTAPTRVSLTSDYHLNPPFATLADHAKKTVNVRGAPLMRIMFVYFIHEDAGSAQDVHNY